jgi:hypothetical protein
MASRLSFSRPMIGMALLVLLWSTIADGLVRAKGDDSCPEPNDQYQAACVLKADAESLGFLSRADDLDIYRIESLDWDSTIKVSINQSAGAYRVAVFDWTGTPLSSASTEGGLGVVEAKLSHPGSYFVTVDSATGEFSDDQPYRLAATLTYPSGAAPQVIATAEFRAGASEGTDRGFDPVGFANEGGSYVARQRVAGNPNQAVRSIRLWGPTLDDFTVTVDTRVIEGPQGEVGHGVIIPFRMTIRPDAPRRPDGGVNLDGLPGYYLQADVQARRVRLLRGGGDPNQFVTEWLPAPMLGRNSVNRFTARLVGEEFTLWINTQQAFKLTDGSFRRGQTGMGALTWGDPAAVRFDNVLITTPGSR